jgi:class 3 adenylate cyclase/pimeloyl-ACP methyl ester carboxylesterase
MEPSIRFCVSRDGTQLAYATIGQGIPLVHIPGSTTNIEFEWNDPESHDWIERVASSCVLIRCQRRGVGASQRDVTDLSLRAQVDDLTAVIAEIGDKPLAILAPYDAATVAIAYAVQNPGRVSHLVLWAPYVREQGARGLDALADLATQNFQLFLRTWAALCFPSGPTERQRWYAHMVRESTSPDVVAAYIRFMRDTDVSDLLPRLHVPTLIFHRAGDRYVPRDVTRALAPRISGATFIPLEGDIGIPVFGDFGYLNRMFEFIGAASVDSKTSHELVSAPVVLRTVLFTDLVGHTEMMRRLGDDRGREVLREHERITRDLLKQHGGAEVKTMGDGFLASFASVTKAIDCAIALQRAFAKHEGEPLQVRVGLNAGEPIEEDGDLFGSTVIMASRIAAKAGAGEILIPEPLRHLLTGKSYVYADRGETMLKGFEDAVRLYEVRWRD